MLRSLILAVGFALPLVGLLGCGATGKTALPEPLPIKGKLTTVGGKPFGDVYIQFQPKDAPAPAGGPVASDGTFSLKTYEGKEGICSGKYLVYIKSLQGADAKKTNPEQKKLAEKYTDEGSLSPIEVIVEKAASTVDVTFDPAAK